MNHLPRAVDLKLAMDNADVEAIEDAAQALGRAAAAQVLAEQFVDRSRALVPSPEDERQRAHDALMGDVTEVARRHRERLGRRVCSASDARITRLAFEMFRGMADASGGADNDASFQ